MKTVKDYLAEGESCWVISEAPHLWHSVIPEYEIEEAINESVELLCASAVSLDDRYIVNMVAYASRSEAVEKVIADLRETYTTDLEKITKTLARISEFESAIDKDSK
jgi:hypothetical protein